MDKYAKEPLKKQQKAPKITEMRFHKNIGEHDLEIKLNKIEEALKKKHQVKIRLQLIGRERSRPKEGVQWLIELTSKFTEIATLNRQPTTDNLVVILFPKK